MALVALREGEVVACPCFIKKTISSPSPLIVRPNFKRGNERKPCLDPNDLNPNMVLKESKFKSKNTAFRAGREEGRAA